MLKTSVAILVFVLVCLVLWSLPGSEEQKAEFELDGIFGNIASGGELFPYRTRLTQNLTNDSCPVFVEGDRSIVYTAEVGMEMENDGLFTKKESLLSHLFLLDLQTGERRRLSQEGDFDQFPKPSWSGHKVVFQGKGTDPSSSTELFCIDLLSGERVRLTDDGISKATPALAPGDSVCVYASGRGGICLLDLTTGKSRSIYYRHGLFRWSRLPMLPDLPSFSPDGVSIVFQSGLIRKSIFMMDARGHNIRLLSPGEEDCFHPCFSPDGGAVLFVWDRKGSDNLYLLRLSGRELIQITFDDEQKAYPSFSPDGKKIVFAAKPRGSDDCYYDLFVISKEPFDFSPREEDYTPAI